MDKDWTLEELRPVLAVAVAREAAFDGWGKAAIDRAAEAENIDPDVARLAFKGGAIEIIDHWFLAADEAMARAWPAERLEPLKIRERIAALEGFRIDHFTGFEEALRRAMAILALPQNLPRSTAIGWRSADRMWRLAGDRATDYNHYTKRMMLGAIDAAMLAVLVDDESEGKAETRAFLDRRIEGVMRFEKAKAQWLGRRRDRFSLTRFLGRLRYPAR